MTCIIKVGGSWATFYMETTSPIGIIPTPIHIYNTAYLERRYVGSDDVGCRIFLNYPALIPERTRYFYCANRFIRT